VDGVESRLAHAHTIPLGPGSAAGIAMVSKHIEFAQVRWRAVYASHLVALVRAGARFENGKLIERPPATNPTTSSATYGMGRRFDYQTVRL
jgi:hypothetical protein